jgi:anti-sigma-K factor RskA
LSIAPVKPPAALRARILDQLATTPQLGPIDGPALAAAGPVEERARRRWSARPISAIIAVAAAAALIFGGWIAVNAVIQGQQASATAAQIGSIQAAADYRRTTVTTDDATATLIWAASLKRSALVVHGMPALPGGKTYELWYIDKKGATPAGTFDASDSTQSIVLAGDMKAGDSIGVTIEPAGGSKTPTTSPIMVVSTA